MHTIDLEPRQGRFVVPRRARASERDTTWALGACLALFSALFWRMHAALDPRPSAAVMGRATAAALQAPAVPRGPLTEEERSSVELFQRLAPSVVHITTVTEVRRSIWSLDVMQVPQGTGTGFVWDDAQRVVTNFHVVQPALSPGGEVQVNFDGEPEPIPAKIVGLAPEHDLAVLQLVREPSKKRAPISLGSSGDLLVGQRVYAIGNPFGLDQTLTTGIISGLHREIRSPSDHRIRDVIQTDAAINPGNSGGPLLDSAGRLIGINTAIVSPSGAYAGVGFAVPVDVARRAVPQLIEKGRVSRPGLGIYMIPDELMRYNGLRGVGIEKVEERGPAARAGLRSPRELENGRLVPDIILSVDGQKVERQRDLFDLLDGRRAGESVKVRVRRGGEVFEVEVALAELR
jgi:S1-C subfamily serine protease